MNEQVNKKQEIINKTGFMIKIILIFFLVIIVTGIGFYFLYNVFQVKGSLLEVHSTEIDNEFNNLFNEDNKNKIKQEDEFIEYEKNNCYVDKLMIKDGDVIKLFSRKIVGLHQNCDDYFQKRICDDGYMLGNDKFKFVKCKKDLDCQLVDFTILKNTESIKLYSKKVVPFGETCERYAAVRTCGSSVLSGDDRYIYKNCKISYDNSCEVNNGHILANNQTHVFYKKSLVSFGEKCNDISKRLMCSNAVIQGGDLFEYKYWNCREEEAQSCYIDNKIITHGSIQKLYSKQYGTNARTCSFYNESFKCIDGILKNIDGDYTSEEYKYVKCYDN